MSAAEWINAILQTAWPPETWIILLGVRLLNLIALTAIIHELLHSRKYTHLLHGVCIIWAYYFINLYVVSDLQTPANFAYMWINLGYAFVETIVWYELRKIRMKSKIEANASSYRKLQRSSL